MPKMKTHRGAAKRFKKTGSGKLKRAKAYRSHNAKSKTHKQVRQLRKSGVVSKSDYKRISELVTNI